MENVKWKRRTSWPVRGCPWQPDEEKQETGDRKPETGWTNKWSISWKAFNGHYSIFIVRLAEFWFNNSPGWRCMNERSFSDINADVWYNSFLISSEKNKITCFSRPQGYSSADAVKLFGVMRQGKVIGPLINKADKTGTVKTWSIDSAPAVGWSQAGV